MKLTFKWCEEHFEEANDFVTGKKMNMPENSAIRLKAMEVFNGSNYIQHLTAVCSEIFRVIAAHYVELPRYRRLEDS